MPDVSAVCDSPVFRHKDVLTRVVMQERENAILQGDVCLWEEEAKRAAAEEKAAFAEVSESLQEVVRLCMWCAASTQDEVVLNAVAQELISHAQQEDAEARSFALEEQNARIRFLQLSSADSDEEEVTKSMERHKLLERAADEEATRERREIMQLEQERLELEKRTELATLQYARELFNVHV